MISLILPYWERQKATDAAMWTLAEHYGELELEIVVVDDGSIEEPFEQIVDPYDPETCAPFDVTVVRLPKKKKPLNPCVPYNRGVEVSRGEFIALSNPETLHTMPVLEAMRDTIKDDMDYVIAAAKCGDRWHCHSSRERRNDNDVGAYLPRGADYHFMTMMKRSLWDAAQGFDEDYRLGAGYDDPDFVRRLHRAGARFIRRDDLRVEHVRSGAHAPWTAEMFQRNRAIFMGKWAPFA